MMMFLFKICFIFSFYIILMLVASILWEEWSNEKSDVVTLGILLYLAIGMGVYILG